MKDIKAICVILLAGVTALATTSCRFEDDDYFGESAALRIEHKAQDMQHTLASAQNGWVIQYFCGREVSVFEGFNLFASFDQNSKVTMAGNHRFLRDGNAGKYTESTSLYQILKEEGLVLAFNTWNDILTPFVDPVAWYYAPELIVKDGAGMNGDQNLVVLSFSDKEILLRGERFQGHVRMIPCDRPWQDYISDSETMRNAISSDAVNEYYVTNGTETKYISGLHNGRMRYSEQLVNYVQNDSLSCVFTPTGLRFETPVELGEDKFQELTLTDDKTHLVSEDGKVTVTAAWSKYLATTGDIFWIDMESVSDDLKAEIEKVAAAFTAWNKNSSLSRIGFGLSNASNGVNGIVVEWGVKSFGRITLYKGGLSMKRHSDSLGELTIESFDEPLPDNSLSGSNRGKVVEAVYELGKVLSTTWSLTPDSYFAPTTVTYTAKNGSATFTTTKQ